MIWMLQELKEDMLRRLRGKAVEPAESALLELPVVHGPGDYRDGGRIVQGRKGPERELPEGRLRGRQRHRAKLGQGRRRPVVPQESQGPLPAGNRPIAPCHLEQAGMSTEP